MEYGHGDRFYKLGSRNPPSIKSNPLANQHDRRLSGFTALILALSNIDNRSNYLQELTHMSIGKLRNLVIINFLLPILPIILAFIFIFIIAPNLPTPYSADSEVRGSMMEAALFLTLPLLIYIVPFFVFATLTIIDFIWLIAYVRKKYPRNTLFIFSCILTALMLLLCIATSSLYLRTLPDPKASAIAKNGFAEDKIRATDIANIINAIWQYSKDHNNTLPPNLAKHTPEDTFTEIGQGVGMVDICADLVPKYLPALPRDPRIYPPEKYSGSCPASYKTGYLISLAGNHSMANDSAHPNWVQIQAISFRASNTVYRKTLSAPPNSIIW